MSGGGYSPMADNEPSATDTPPAQNPPAGGDTQPQQ